MTGKAVRYLIFSFLGFSSSFFVIGGLALIEVYSGYAFYSQMVIFIVPVGAIISGVGAAGGYYVGAIILDAKPTAKILFNMVAISIVSYFLLHYAVYLLLEIGGVHLSYIMDFFTYLDKRITDSSITISVGHASRDMGGLGSMGYAYAALQVVGFAFGGVMVYLFLKNKTYCDICGRYYDLEWQYTRYYGENDQDEFLKTVESVAKAFDNSDIEGARSIHEEIKSDVPIENVHLRTEMMLERCPKCECRLLSFIPSRYTGGDWNEIGELSWSAVFPRNK